ncbi:hypothetical protein, partial [Bittarella massiliensis (ex Durand et al. 2017)]
MRGGGTAGATLVLCLLVASSPTLAGLLPAAPQAVAAPHLQVAGEVLAAPPKEPLAYLQPLYAQNSDL